MSLTPQAGAHTGPVSRWTRLVTQWWVALQRRVIKIVGRFGEQEHLFLVLAAILLGVAGAYGAIGFRYLILLSGKLFSGASLLTPDSPPWGRVALLLLTPAFGGLLVGLLVSKVAGEVKGSGIPEVMEAVGPKKGIIRIRVMFTKALAAALTIGSGGSAGREGPIVHIGSAMGSALGQLLGASTRHLRTFVACGTAAAIAATFNAPIAGALFAMEVVLGEMGVVSMSPIVISSVVATVISRHYLGDFPAFVAPQFTLVSAYELLLYALIGLCAGALAILFIKGMAISSSVFDRISIPGFLKPALGGLLVGGISLMAPQVLGVGYPTINHALAGDLGGDGWRLAGLWGLIAAAKLVATCFTLGAGGSGGVFAPSLFVGASLGAALGLVVHNLFPMWTAPANAYALVGMGAMVSAATHAPITAILVIFELTNNYKIIPPLMLACVIGVLFSSYFKRDSIYTDKLSRKGVRLRKGRDVNLLGGIKVAEVMSGDLQMVRAEQPVGAVFNLLLSGKSPSAVVVDKQGAYVGMVALQDVREVIRESEELAMVVVAADVADRQAPFVYPSHTLDVVMRQIGRGERDEVPVLAGKESRQVIGVVRKKAVIDAYNERLATAELADGLGASVLAVADGGVTQVFPGVHLKRCPVPGSWVGQSLLDLDIRQRHGIQVVLVQRSAKELMPGPNLVFEPGDQVLILGRDLERIRL